MVWRGPSVVAPSGSLRCSRRLNTAEPGQSFSKYPTIRLFGFETDSQGLRSVCPGGKKPGLVLAMSHDEDVTGFHLCPHRARRALPARPRRPTGETAHDHQTTDRSQPTQRPGQHRPRHRGGKGRVFHERAAPRAHRGPCRGPARRGRRGLRGAAPGADGRSRARGRLAVPARRPGLRADVAPQPRRPSEDPTVHLLGPAGPAERDGGGGVP